MTSIGDIVKSQGQQVDLVLNELSVTKQLIKERAHPLDLLRELISNAGAKEVGATEVRIKYTIDDPGHVFEVQDNGCGMSYTGNRVSPGRLDKFLGLGLSNIVGIQADEFSWKGLGSKLAYQSKRLELDTWTGTGPAYRVEINEPWNTIEAGRLPRPNLFEYQPDATRKTGTTIRVIGHPPHRQEAPFTVDEILNFLRHRTFIGFTRDRDAPPAIHLSVLGKSQTVDFGFPELRQTTPEKGTLKIDESHTHTKPGTNKKVTARMKGFITWDDAELGISPALLNTGLILSVKGIPYFALDMEAYGSRSIGISNPGHRKCCLVLECDDVQGDMNISRSALVDSETTLLLKEAVGSIFVKLEKSQRYLDFRQVPTQRKMVGGADRLAELKAKLEGENQNWVVYQGASGKAAFLGREPENENDVLSILWRLEALGGLPFSDFRTLAHIGKGCDLLVHFREDDVSHPERCTSVEVENRFSNYSAHGHIPAQYPRVICWTIGSSPKLPVNKTDKKYKFVAPKDDYQIHIFCLRHMDGVRVVNRKELDKLAK